MISLVNTKLKEVRYKYHFIKHIPIDLVFWRIYYSIKRKCLSTSILPFKKIALSYGGDHLYRDLPYFFVPLISLDTKSVIKKNESYQITFLNETHEFSLPFDWHKSVLNKGTRLWKLNLHYFEFCRQLDDEDFVMIIEDWISQNQHYCKDYWKDVLNSYALSIRVVVWLQQITLRKTRLSEKFLTNIAQSIYMQTMLLTKNIELDICGNHIIKNIKALFWSGRYFQDEGEKFYALGRRLLHKEIKIQVSSDGMHFEGSPSYHCQVFFDLLEVYQVAHINDQEFLKPHLLKMVNTLQKLTHPDGFVSQFNDGGLHMTYSPAQCIQAYDSLIGDRPGLALGDIQLADSGYYGFVDSDCYILAKFGRIGPDELVAHAHADLFSFELTIGKSRAIVDYGTDTYNPGKQRYAARSTLVHNTVTLDDHDQAEIFGSFRIGSRPLVSNVEYRVLPGGFSLTGQHNGYRRQFKLPDVRRTITYEHKKIVLEDDVLGKHHATVVSRLLMHPDVVVEQINTNECLCKLHQYTLRIQSTGIITLAVQSYCPDFGLTRKTSQLCIEYGAGAKQGISTITVEK